METIDISREGVRSIINLSISTKIQELKDIKKMAESYGVYVDIEKELQQSGLMPIKLSLNAELFERLEHFLENQYPKSLVCHREKGHSPRQRICNDTNREHYEQIIPKLIRRYIEHLKNGNAKECFYSLSRTLYRHEPQDYALLCECAKKNLDAQVQELFGQLQKTQHADKQ